MRRAVLGLLLARSAASPDAARGRVLVSSLVYEAADYTRVANYLEHLAGRELAG